VVDKYGSLGEALKTAFPSFDWDLDRFSLKLKKLEQARYKEGQRGKGGGEVEGDAGGEEGEGRRRVVREAGSQGRQRRWGKSREGKPRETLAERKVREGGGSQERQGAKGDERGRGGNGREVEGDAGREVGKRGGGGSKGEGGERGRRLRLR
jgi:hypothetical protein